LQVSDCTGYAITPVPGCSAKFTNGSAAADATATATAASDTASSPASRAVLSKAAAEAGASVARATAAPLTSLLDYLIGPGG
jgi:hypothetical protein